MKAAARPEDLDSATLNEVNLHRVPRLGAQDKCCLLTSTALGRCFPGCCWPKYRKLRRLYGEGMERIDRELDIVKIIKTLRMAKIFLKSSLVTPDIKFAIQHAE